MNYQEELTKKNNIKNNHGISIVALISILIMIIFMINMGFNINHRKFYYNFEIINALAALFSGLMIYMFAVSERDRYYIIIAIGFLIEGVLSLYTGIFGTFPINIFKIPANSKILSYVYIVGKVSVSISIIIGVCHREKRIINNMIKLSLLGAALVSIIFIYNPFHMSSVIKFMIINEILLIAAAYAMYESHVKKEDAMTFMILVGIIINLLSQGAFIVLSKNMNIRLHFLMIIEIVVNILPLIGGDILGHEEIVRHKITLEEFKKFFLAVEQNSSAVIITNNRGEVEYANSKLLEMTGYDFEELKGKMPYKLVCRDNVDIFRNDMKEKLLNGEEWMGELKSLKKDRTCYWQRIRISPIKDDKGNITNYLSIHEDITESKRISEELKNSENLYRQITENMLDLIMMINLDGTIKYISPTVEEKLEYSREELIGKSFFEKVHPYDLLEVKSYFSNKSFLECTARKMEFRYRHSNGHYIWFEAISNNVMNDGEIIGAVLTIRSITRRKEMERILRESEERYRNFFNILPDYICVIDSNNYSIIEANESFVNKIGMKFDEIKKYSSFFDSCVKNNIKEIIKMIKNGEKITSSELELKDLNGKSFFVDVNFAPNYEDNEITSILCIGRDITEKKRMEQLKKYAEERMRILNEAMQYEKIKTEFLANISHELRTPLNVILGALQLLDLNMKSNLIYDKDNKLNRYSAIMKQNCYRLLRIVNNLIDITKIDSGFSKLNLKNENIVNIVEDIALSVADYVENKSIQLIFDTEIEEKIMAFDADKLERIILNLISNAVKFTPAGGLINVSIYDCIDSIKISVKDNGIGIPKDKLEIIFERFRQVDKSLTRNHEGSGIGLSLVKSFVEMHGGRIDVYSTEGEGSEFIVELPVRLVEEETETISSNDDMFNARIQRISVEFSDIYS